jgi:hypothetical protein
MAGELLTPPPKEAQLELLVEYVQSAVSRPTPNTLYWEEESEIPERRRGQTLPVQTLPCVAPWADSVGIDAKMAFDLLGIVVGIELLVATLVIELLNVTPMLVVLTFGSGATIVLGLALISDKLE